MLIDTGKSTSRHFQLPNSKNWRLFSIKTVTGNTRYLNRQVVLRGRYSPGTTPSCSLRHHVTGLPRGVAAPSTRGSACPNSDGDLDCYHINLTEGQLSGINKTKSHIPP